MARQRRRPSDRQHDLGRRGDQRNPYERDRDRILYTSAFLRLAGVTQVTHAAEGHIFHNRLTHSLKVAQIARRLAEFLVRQNQQTASGKRLLSSVGGIEPEVAEAAGLAHDLGHPPFGHVAEEELDQFLRKKRVRDGFEGNPQSFRIVTKVAIRSTEHLGLNLTLRTLNAIQKYPWPRAKRGKKHRKWGYYTTEAKEFREARSYLDRRDRRRTIEAEIMDWADDVTYAVHDVDDFYRAGLIPLDRLLSDSGDERDRFLKWARSNGGADAKSGEFFVHLASYCNLRKPFAGSKEDRAELDALVTLLIRRYVVGTEEENPRRAARIGVSRKGPRLVIEPTLRKEVDLLKDLTRFYVFSAPALVAQQYGQRRIIRDLASIFFEALGKPGAAGGDLIPEPFRGAIPRSRAARARVVADVITSMTEHQAIVLHQRLSGMVPGSVRDVILY